jgi:molybdenum cofactor synthesis domain-containing protein
MRDHGAAVIEHDVGEESFIPAHEAAADERAGEQHRPPLPEPGRENKPRRMQMPNPTAAMLTIGDEILSGRTQDTNMNHLAKALTEAGIDLCEARTVPDDERAIVDALNALRERWDHVFTSGGIGPTHDDITADCVARAFGVGIDVREDARAILATNYADPERELNAARLRMARVPDGAALIDNPVSKAPGFTIGNVHVMAGVPAVFRAMVAGVLPTLTGGRPLLSATVRADHPEGMVAGPLAEIAAAHPATSIGSYPFVRDGVFGTNLVVRSSDPAALAAAQAAVAAMVAGLG